MNCTVFQKHMLRSPPAWTAQRTLSFPVLCTCHQLQCSCYLVNTDIHKISEFKRIALKERNTFLFFKRDVSFAGWNRRNLLYFGRTFCRLNYVGITVLTHVWSWTVMQVMTRQVFNKTGDVYIMHVYNIETCSCNHRCCQKAITINIFWVCVFVALGIQHAMCVHEIVISDLPSCTIFSTLSHKGSDFPKKRSYWT